MPSPFFTNPRSNPELRSLHEIVLLPQQSHLQDYFLGVMAILSEYFSIRYSALFLKTLKRIFSMWKPLPGSRGKFTLPLAPAGKGP